MSENLFKVEKIVNKKLCEANGRWLYLVKWEGYDSDESTWEPEENLCYIPKLLETFNHKWQAKEHLKKKKQQQKLERLSEIKKKNLNKLQKSKKDLVRETINSNEIIQILDNLDPPSDSEPIPQEKLFTYIAPGALPKDSISSIIGVREFEGSLYFAVLFLSNGSDTPSINVFSKSFLILNGYESMVGGYIIERLKSNY